MAKKIELDERVLKIQAQLDEKIEYVNDLNTEKAQLEALYKSKLEALKAQFDKKVESIQGNVDYTMQEIRVLFDQVPHKSTATQEKVSVLSGDVVLKKASVDFDYDKKTLLEQAQRQLQEPLTDQFLATYIKTKEVSDFDWAKFKEKLVIGDNFEIIDALTGEVIQLEGLKVIQKPEQLIIK